MLYEFTHTQTPDGRRVAFVLLAEDYDRAVSVVPVDYFAGAGVTRQGDEVALVLSVRAAIRLRDALALVGGAAVASRTLGEHFDTMVEEVQRERAGLFGVTRRVSRFLNAASL